MRIRKGDQIIITKGKDRGRKGKVLKSFPRDGKILLEGLNMKKMHRKPRKQGEKGQIVEIPSPIDVSKIKLVCPKCGKPTRVGYRIEGENKTRVCKKCGGEV